MGDERGAEREAEDALGTDDEREEAETEEDGVVVESRFTIDADAIDWLERLTTDAPVLGLGLLDFVDGFKSVNAGVSREEFTKGLSKFVDDLDVGQLPTELIEKLFERVTQDRQMMSAYDAFRDVLRSDRFGHVRQFVEQELVRLKLISELLRRPEGSVAPRILGEWDEVWIGSLRELTNRTKNQLHSTKDQLVGLQGFLRYGRTDLESYLLEQTHSFITKEVKGRKPRISAHKVLVAYAFASNLLPYRGSTTTGDPVKAMKIRMSRVKHLKTRIPMLTLLLAQMIKSQEKIK